MVTVAWFQTKSWAIGEPTILERPRTTAFAPKVKCKAKKRKKEDNLELIHHYLITNLQFVL
jgi:hypothetical protein